MSTDRVSKLATAMQRNGVDAMFLSTPISMGYMCGFFEDAHERFLALAISASGQVLAITPSLSVTQALRSGIVDVRGWKDGEDPMAHVVALATDWSLNGRIVAVDDGMRAKALLDLQAALPGVQFVPAQPVLAELMRIKDDVELDTMRRSGALADVVFEQLKTFIQAGLTEREVERFIRDAFTDLGAKPTFCIVGAGPGGAEPHHINGDTKLASGDVVILDFGCDLDGYQSDITRTVCIGSASPKAKAVYDIVYRAYMAGRAAIQPGATSDSVDSAARSVIEEAGYGPKFFHRLGHGIGMNGHEDPNIIGGSSQVLEPGNCFSIEPGIYLEGEFGVRIETIVACSASGHENLNAEPSPTLLELG